MSDQWTFVIVSYAITWVVLLGYSVHVTRRWARARRVLEAEGG